MPATIPGYELLECIGRGGMGEVWRARQVALDRFVAIKLIRPDVAAPDGLLARRFEREARAAAALRSPHAIAIRDFGVADGVFYQVMELLEGYDLHALVEQLGPLPPARAVLLLRQACDALAEAHGLGLVHRDIKPSNLFLCRSGAQVDFLKVVDFGLARTSSAANPDTRLTQVGTLPGSPAFLAPEVIRGADAPTDKADVYALGCVAWWLLSGRLVFPGVTAIDMILGHIERAPPPLEGVPEALAERIRACLAKDPAARPTARELSRQLSALPLEPWTEEAAEAWWDAHRPVAVPTPAAPTAEAPPVDVGPAREQAYAALRRHFEQSRIDLLEFEKRLEVARVGGTIPAVNAALSGLPEAPPVATPAVVPSALTDTVRAPAPLVPVAPTEIVASPSREWVSTVTVMGGTTRGGSWQPPRRARFVSVMGGTELDLRSARLEPGLTEIRCVAVMGGVHIRVPPELYVEVAGVGVLGGFDGPSMPSGPPTDGRPWVRVTGVAVMGGVDVEVVQPPGTALAEVAAQGAEMLETVMGRWDEGRERARERRRKRKDRDSG